MAFRCEVALVDEGTEYRAGLPSFVVGRLSSSTTREFGCDDRLLESQPGAARQPSSAHLFLAADFDAAEQLGGLQQAFHESDPVNAGLQEKFAELFQPLLGELAAAVQITTARPIGSRKQLFVTAA